MNRILSVQDGVMAAPKEYAKLETKDFARLLVISDTHGIDFEALKTVVQNFGTNCDALIFCGDGVEDICKLVTLSEADDDLFQKLPKVIVFVKGNNDSIFYNSPFQIKAPKVTCTTIANKKILVSHGNDPSFRFSSSFLGASLFDNPSLQDANLVFFGHSHIQESFVHEKTLFVNPGSLSLPRNAQNRSFAIISFPGVTSKVDVEFYSFVKNITGYSFSMTKGQSF